MVPSFEHNISRKRFSFGSAVHSTKDLRKSFFGMFRRSSTSVSNLLKVPYFGIKTGNLTFFLLVFSSSFMEMVLSESWEIPNRSTTKFTSSSKFLVRMAMVSPELNSCWIFWNGFLLKDSLNFQILNGETLLFHFP